MMRTVIEGCAIATVDPARAEYRDGHLVIEDDRIVAVGEGAAPEYPEARWIDGRGHLATPGLVNCHHHLYQWATRGLAQQATLFDWLVELYPVWALIDDETCWAAARAGLAALARSGCSASIDHHYVFPRGAGDLLEVEIGDAAISRFHDPAPGAMVRIALAPCSPFSVTRGLMADAAQLGRRRGVRLHTHLAETLDEERFCRERFGVRPVDYLDELGWLGEDVWLAHCVHLEEAEIGRFGATGTGVAHCPNSNARLGAGIAPVADLVRARVPVGLGVDGAASNEDGGLAAEMRTALQFARLAGGPQAMTARQALAHATIDGARCLGRDDELGSLEVGKLADVALWRLDGLEGAGIEDPVAALVLGATDAVELLLVGGRPVVEGGELRTADEAQVAGEIARASRRLAAKTEAQI
jgi:cytosine/adenosine deaminase-related metal-dependent hydrolase